MSTQLKPTTSLSGTGTTPTHPDPDELLKEKEAAQVLNVTSRCLENWRHRGDGCAFIRISSRCVRYKRSDLLAFIEERRRANTSDSGEEN